MTDATPSPRENLAEATTIAFVADRLQPSLQRVEEAADSDGGLEELDSLGPALMVYRRDLRLLAAGIHSGYFIPIEELARALSDVKLASEAAVERVNRALSLYRRSGVLPRHLQSRAIAVRLGFFQPPLKNAPFPTGEGRPAAGDVRQAIAVSMWLGMDPDLLSFACRAETLPDPDWQDALLDATEAFGAVYDFCDCNGHGSRSSRTEATWLLEERSRWLFAGAFRLLAAIDDSEMLGEFNETVGDSLTPESISLRLLQQAYRSGTRPPGPAGPYMGIDGLLGPGIGSSRFYNRMVAALRAVWSAVERTIPRRFHDVVYADVTAETQYSRGLLAESGAPVLDLGASHHL